MNCPGCNRFIPASSSAADCPFCKQPLHQEEQEQLPPKNREISPGDPGPARRNPESTRRSPTPGAANPPPPRQPSLPPQATQPAPAPALAAAAGSGNTLNSLKNWAGRHPFLSILFSLAGIILVTTMCNAALRGFAAATVPDDQKLIAQIAPTIVSVHTNASATGFGYLVDKDSDGNAFIYTDNTNIRQSNRPWLPIVTDDGQRHRAEIVSTGNPAILKVDCPDCRVIPFGKDPGEVVDKLAQYDDIIAVAQLDSNSELQVIHTHIMELRRRTDGIWFTTADQNFDLPLKPSVLMSDRGKAFGVLFTTRRTPQGISAIFEYTSQEEVKETIQKAGGYR